MDGWAVYTVYTSILYSVSVQVYAISLLDYAIYDIYKS